MLTSLSEVLLQQDALIDLILIAFCLGGIEAIPKAQLLIRPSTQEDAAGW